MGLHKRDVGTVRTAGINGWWFPMLVILLALVLVLGGESARLGLRFDRTGILSGELWRLVTGHFVHLGAPHFALNAAGLALVWYLVGTAYNWRNWLLVAAVSLVTMDLGLWIVNPTLDWYVGLSGLLHAFLAAGLVRRMSKTDTETLVLTALLLGKLAWEQLSGPLPGSEGTAGGSVVVDAHLFGALGGALTAIALRIRTRRGTPI
ncbi:MAG: rhombosortase [Woeseiaceae bacterium]